MHACPRMPIKRHSALLSLSRDHHLALQLARAIQSGVSPNLRAELPKGTQALRDHVCRVFAEEIEKHFAAEESVVMPAVKGHDEGLDEICKEILAQHRAMRALVEQAADTKLDEASTLSLLDRFGQLLESHVRTEERSFYQRIQEVLDEKSLEAIAANLERHLRVPTALHPPR